LPEILQLLYEYICAKYTRAVGFLISIIGLSGCKSAMNVCENIFFMELFFLTFGEGHSGTSRVPHF
jgi:hypothetical protein